MSAGPVIDVIKYGFRDWPEFHRLVSQADISTPEKLAAFKNWQRNDCTKDGLLNLSKAMP